MQYCLECLCHQTIAKFEVLIIDDGSEGAAQVAQTYQTRLELRYERRGNDGSPARSRNRGAELAQHNLLLFIDSDILLNPDAVAAYCYFLTPNPNYLLYGYVGTVSEGHSFWFSEVSIHWLDKRFNWRDGHLRATEKLFLAAHECAYSGNFAIHRQTFFELNGFDPRFQGWGGEDLDLGERAIKQGKELHFLIDAWAEHQVHARDSLFHLKPSEQREHFYRFKPHPPVPYTVRCLGSKQAYQKLTQTIQSHYQPL